MTHKEFSRILQYSYSLCTVSEFRCQHLFQHLALQRTNFLSKGLATHSILLKTQDVPSYLREFTRNRVRWVHPPNMMDKRAQLTISTVWLVNRILATVIISFLPRFCVWQSSARPIHGLFIMCFVWRTCGWSQREDNSRKCSHKFYAIFTSVWPGL